MGTNNFITIYFPNRVHVSFPVTSEKFCYFICHLKGFSQKYFFRHPISAIMIDLSHSGIVSSYKVSLSGYIIKFPVLLVDHSILCPRCHQIFFQDSMKPLLLTRISLSLLRNTTKKLAATYRRVPALIEIPASYHLDNNKMYIFVIRNMIDFKNNTWTAFLLGPSVE
jgi:hypothetical protein